MGVAAVDGAGNLDESVALSMKVHAVTWDLSVWGFLVGHLLRCRVHMPRSCQWAVARVLPFSKLNAAFAGQDF